LPVTGLTRTFQSPSLQDNAAVLKVPHKSTRRSQYGSRRRWSLRAAIPLWIALAVAGWSAVVLSVYSFMRHENEVAVIDKIEQPDGKIARETKAPDAPVVGRDDIDRVNTVAPAAGPGTKTSTAPQN